MRRYLVVANQTLGGEELIQELRRRVESGPCSFHVLVPRTPVAQQSRDSSLSFGSTGGGLGPSADPEREATVRARGRLTDLLTELRAMGTEVDGELGNPDPLEAIGDALRSQKFDEVIVSTLPEGLSRWLRMDLSHKVQRRFEVPVTTITAKA